MPATILYVEDERFVREVTREVLESAGYRVLTAASSNEAVEMYQASPSTIDLLLTDVILPGQTGRSLARRLRQQHPALIVMLATGYGDQMDAHEPGEEVLPKPFSSQVLLQRVRQALAGRCA